MNISFTLHYKTEFGENLQWVAHSKDKKSKAYSMRYVSDNQWKIDFKTLPDFKSYSYQLTSNDANYIKKEHQDRIFHIPKTDKNIEIYDHWNTINLPENYLLKPFFSNRKVKPKKPSLLKSSTHFVTLKAFVKEGSQIVMVGNSKPLGNWETEKALPLKETTKGHWTIALNLKSVDYSTQYKFGIKTGDFIELEEGYNRVLPTNTLADKIISVNEVFYKYSAYQMPKKAGLAIPVFSLRTKNSLGIGEFSDLKPMGDWLSKLGISLLQILPINDTIAHHNWNDCYPYAAISVYALNPFYLSIKDIKHDFSTQETEKLKSQSEQLNALSTVDLDQVMEVKWKWIHQIFNQNFAKIVKDKVFQKFIKENKDWLYSYSVFCVLRDANQTADFSQWKILKKYSQKKVEAYFSTKHKDYEKALLYAWVQYLLDSQLKSSIEYLHHKNINIKGDLPIGIYRHSVEAWKEPELFGMDFQAGAPPDDFAVLGQNWEFPTYNWELMKANGFTWWKNRFQALAKYFDAMRIDHVLGFFRIWRIAKESTQGIMGYFYPAIPIKEEEFGHRNIHFNYDRFCKPYINSEILYNQFREKSTQISSFFMDEFYGQYYFKEAFNTQRKLVEFLNTNSEFEDFKSQLLYLLSNVLFLTENRDGETVYHPRFNFSQIETFHHLDPDTQHKLHALYNDYFFVRQDQKWMESAFEKLPVLLEATDMLICGEDLGLVPNCVPKVMDDLAILSLQIQRMTSDDRLYSDPAYAPYLSVVTPGSHDTSTLRQWWNEDRNDTQHYYNHQLQRHGTVTDEIYPDMMEQIIRQHLSSPAMLAVIPIQEYLALTEETTNPNKEEERINIPANFPHYWQYRMHISCEDLLQNEPLTQKIKHLVIESGRD